MRYGNVDDMAGTNCKEEIAIISIICIDATVVFLSKKLNVQQ